MSTRAAFLLILGILVSGDVRSDGGKGTMRFRRQGAGEPAVVSVKEFCRVLGCSFFYQWPAFRVVIRGAAAAGGAHPKSAVVSPLVSQALVDGRLIEYAGRIVRDPRDGYLLPADLAARLAFLLDLGRIEGAGEGADGSPASKAPPGERAGAVPAASQRDEASGTEINILVIDPGHGGADFGTRHGRLLEKDIALFYAIKLKQELREAMPDLSVFLTREDDFYVSLPDRAKLANGRQASFFLSLHANHAVNAAIGGSETYILNPNATDDDAKRTALLENDSWLRTLKEKEAANDFVMKILADMEQTRYIQNSAIAASYIQQELSSIKGTLGLKNRGVKQAMFFVLSQVAMPSVLVEMGFLSNAGDRARLMDVVFRDQFVARLVSSIRRYREHMRGKGRNGGASQQEDKR